MREQHVCIPALCDHGAVTHAHCKCGLPTTAGAELCHICEAEGREPGDLRRHRRLVAADTDGHLALALAILSGRRAA